MVFGYVPQQRRWWHPAYRAARSIYRNPHVFNAGASVASAAAVAASRYGSRLAARRRSKRPRGAPLSRGAAGRSLGRKRLRRPRRALKRIKRVKLSLGQKLAYAALTIPPVKKTEFTSDVFTGLSGKSAWGVFGYGYRDQLSAQYQNHEGALVGTYLANPNTRMVASAAMKLTVVNTSNLTQFYKAWVYVAKKDFQWFGDSLLTDFSTYWTDATISGDSMPPYSATGETETALAQTDLQATPGQNKQWTSKNQIARVYEFQLGPGESKTLTTNTGDKVFSPAKFNIEAATVAVTPALDIDAYRGYTGGLIIRCVGTIATEDGAPSTVSTAPTQTSYARTVTLKSAMFQDTQSVHVNVDALPATLTVPVFQAGAANTATGETVAAVLT